MSLKPSCIEALRRIGEVVFPEKIRLGDVSQHLRGYNKQKAIEQLIERAKEDPLMTRLKLFLVYSELEKLKNNGGLLSER